jgi:hypothetical protein
VIKLSIKGIDADKLKSTIDSCLRAVPKTEYEHLPNVLLEKGHTRFFFLGNDKFLVIDFLDDEEAERIQKLSEKGLFPFPGLIKPEQLKMSAAFAFNSSRNGLVRGCSINNMFSFSMGKDSTVIIQDHRQSIKTEELGDYSYTIKLAYLLSFGEEINFENIYSFVRELILNSYKQWGVNLG